MKKILLILAVATTQLLSQEVDIVPALSLIESGNTKSASTILIDLKSKNPGDPSVIFLDALLTKDGDEALKKYSTILEKFPDSKYADASLYRIFSYYYSLGYYKKAETYLNRLRKDFPESSYIKTADIKLPNIEEPPVQIVNKPQTQQPTQSETVETINRNFTIQAGAFMNVENAKKLNEQLKKENYFTEITTKEVGGTILNVVNVGKFVNEEEAKPVLSFIEKKFNLKGRIVSTIK
jgi:cell division septation protein DedD